MVEPIKKSVVTEALGFKYEFYFFILIGTTKKYHIIGTTK